MWLRARPPRNGELQALLQRVVMSTPAPVPAAVQVA